MSLLIQISDPHFGTERAPVVEALIRLVRAEAPGLIVLSGDITQRARRGQFAAARAFIDRLHAPATIAVPGNHDVPLFNLAARLFRPYENHIRVFGADLEPVFESERLLVVTLNTTRRYRHVNGEVSATQIEQVARRLERATATQLRVVVTHHPVSVTHPRDEHDLLRGHRQAVQRWAKAGADLILGGHIHLPFVKPLHEADGSLHRRVWAVQAGTATSSRVRGDIGNSVNLIRDVGLRPRRCVIERWDYVESVDAFRPVATHALSFGPIADAG